MIKLIILIYLAIGALTLLRTHELADEWPVEWTLYTLLGWPAIWIIGIAGYIAGYVQGMKEVIKEAAEEALKKREMEQ